MEAIRATKPVFVPFEAKKEDEVNTWDAQAVSSPSETADALLAPVEPLRMTLDQLRAHIEDREVPLNTPYDAKASLMPKALRSWGGIISDTVERMRMPVSRSVNQLVGQHFGASLNEELRSITSMTAAEVLEGLFVTAATRLDENLKLDHVPYTQNQHYFVSTRDAVLAELRSARAKKNGGGKIVQSANGSSSASIVSTALAGLSAMGYQGLKDDDLKKLLAADLYETELETAAQTAADWQRIIDNGPLIIDASVIRPLPHAFSEALHQRLLSGGIQELERLVAESPELAEQRAELNMRKKRLDDAKKVLLAYGR
ncbi:hypothetical protein JCM10296v2_004281 [Rhodotorula toruloides]